MNFLLIASLAMLSASIANAAPQSDNDAAEETFRRAVERLEGSIGLIRKTGNPKDASGDLLIAEAEFMEAYRAFAVNSNLKATLALVRSADCLRILEHWVQARDRYREVIPLASQNQQVEYEAKAWLGIVKIEQIGLLDHRAASEAADHALRLAQSAGLERLELEILFERAQMEENAGELAGADVTLTKIIDRSRQLGDQQMQQSSLYGRAHLKLRLAEQAYRLYGSLPYKTPLEWSRCEAVELEARQFLQDAKQDLETSSRLAAIVGPEFVAAAIPMEMGLFDALMRNLYSTAEIKRKAHISESESPPLGDDRSPLVSNGRLIEVNLIGPATPGTDQQERRLFIASLRESFQGATPSAGALWRQRYMEGQLYEAEGNLKAALTSYREAAGLVEEERRTLFTDVSRAGFTAEKMDLYDRLVLNLLNRGEESEAFRWIEQSRARATSDLLSSAELRLPTEGERRLYSQMLALRAGNSVPEEPDSITRRTRYEELLDRIRTESPHLLDLVASEPVPYTNFRRALRERSFDLIYYILYQGRLVIWHLGPEHTHVRSYFAPPSELQRLKAKLIDSLSRKESSFASGAAKDLYTFLAQPVVDWIETEHIVVIPPAQLQGLPFQALLDEKSGKYLGEKVAISYAPSASVIANLRPGGPLDNANVLVVVGRDLAHGMDDAAAITSNYKASVVIRPESSTRSIVMQRAANRTVVHFAAHGEYNDADPMRSRIMLGAEPGHTGDLTASEMFELPLRGTALVTLASCEAARLKAESNNELFGITRSLLYAGAQNLLLPAWQVDDEATSFWLGAFYQEARTNPLPRAALLANRAALRDPKFGAHPRFWAAFMLIGH
jgi:CHAT domain-containing protein